MDQLPILEKCVLAGQETTFKIALIIYWCVQKQIELLQMQINVFGLDIHREAKINIFDAFASVNNGVRFVSTIL